MQYGRLPFTGAGVTLGGIVFEQFWIAAVGVGLLAVGALVVRLAWRRDKHAGQA